MTRKMKQLFSVLLSVLLLAGVVPFAAQPLANAADLTISDASGLRSFLTAVANGTNYSGKTVVLSADIDLGNQNMSGVQNNADNAFQGTFDGQGHTIRNFYLSASGAYWGLFRYTAGNAVIKNLNLTSVNVSSNDQDVGALVGYAGGSLTLENVHVRSGSVSGSTHVGGLVGIYKQTSSGSLNMTDCSNAASVSGYYNGGLVGYSESKVGETFIHCYNVGTITTGGGGTGGGLFGYFVGTKDSGIGSSTADWVWFKQCWNGGTVSGGNYMGGIIGYVENSANSEFDQCFNWGNVSSGYMAGGIFSGIGNNSVESSAGAYINNLYNAGNISAGSGYAYDIGWSSTSYSNCYNCGSITSSNNRPGATQWSSSQMQNGAATISSAELVKNTWGVRIGSTTYYYPVHSWYRNLFTFESIFADSDSGTNQTITKTYNNAFTAPNPSKTGYARNGNWYGGSGQLAPGGSYTAGVTAPMNAYVVTESASGPKSSVTYDLNWTPNQYAVTLNANGGEGGTPSVTATYNAAMPSAAMPTRAGYTFAGYYDTSAQTGGTQYYGANGASVRSWDKASASTLWARWSQDSHTLSVDVAAGMGMFSVYVNDENVADDMYTYSGSHLSHAAYRIVPTALEGYHFDSADAPLEGTIIDNDVSVNLTYAINTYAVTFDPSGVGYTVATAPAATVNHGSAVTFTVTLADGYTDSAAPAVTATNGTVTSQKTGNSVAYTVSNITGPTTVTVGAADINTYTVTFKNGYTGETLGTQTVSHGGAATAPDVQAYYEIDGDHEHHKHFTGWDKAFNNVTGALTVTALYADEAHAFGGCTKVDDALHTHTCSKCGYTEQLDHSWTLESSSGSTCVAAGSEVYKCADCNAEKTVTLPLAQHQYTKQTVSDDRLVSAATCRQKAVYYYSCAVCGEAGSNTFEYGDFAAHKFERYETNNDATCTANGTETASCAFGCGETDTREIPDSRLAHEWEWVVDTEATCGDPGVRHEKCKNCDAVQNENTPIEPTGNHTYGDDEFTPAIFPDCGNDGVLAHFECAVCHRLFDLEGEELTSVVDPATNDHDWEWVTDVEPGCYTDGVQHQVCSVCEHTQAENTPIPAAHEFDDWVAPAAPGCGSDGNVGYYHCHVCGDDFDANGNLLATVVDPATGAHEWEWVTDEEPTCGAPGKKHEACKNCDAVRNENTAIDPTGAHEWEWVTDEEPTCGAPGKKHEACKNCDAVQSENTAIEPTGAHEWEWVTDEEPTCGAPGKKHEACKNCDAVRSENTEIPKTAHVWGNWTKVDDDTHSRVCANDPVNHVETEAHTWDAGVEVGDATCLEPGRKLFTCTKCGATKEENTATGAHDMTHTAYKAPTCVADGNPEYWTCATCGKDFADANGETELTEAQLILHDKNAHKFGEMVREVSATCTAQGVKAHKTCEYCGDDFDAEGNKLDTLVIPMLEHNYGAWIDEESAGCTTAGTKGHYTCSMCGDDFDADKNVIEDLTIPATGHTFPLIHVEAKEAGCPNHAALHAPRRSGSPVTVTGNNGNIEYWYCEACGACFADAEGEHENTAADIVIPAAHHMTHVAYKAPTAEAEGNKEYWICEICGEYFSDAAGTRQIADKASVVIPKLTPARPDDDGNSDTRISIWEWLIRFFRRIFSLFGGSGSIC